VKKYVIALLILVVSFSVCHAQSYKDLVVQYKKDFPESWLDKPLRANPDDPHLMPHVVLQYIQAKNCGLAFAWLDELKRVNEAEYNEMVGCMYANGDCVKQSYNDAILFLQMADTESAQLNILMLYQDPFDAGSKKHVSAVKAFKMAGPLANRGFFQAMGLLAYAYARGEGCIQDAEQSYLWFLLTTAFAPNDQTRGSIAEHMNLVRRSLKTEEVERAKKVAQEKYDEILKESKGNKPSSVSYVYGVWSQ
jgi:hypothetical protein